MSARDCQTLLACDDCDRLCTDTGISDSDVICADCRDRNWARCQRCYAWLPLLRMVYEPEGELFGEDWWFCESCSEPGEDE
jgi:hypothetical protein